MATNLNEAQLRCYEELIRDNAGKDIYGMCMAGLCEEAGEIAGLLKRDFQGRLTNPQNYLSELGDLFWYLCNVAQLKGFSMEKVYEYNKQKLEERYGNS